MNQLIIIGNLARDPETGTTASGVNYCRFVVAARKKRPKEGEPDAEFVRVTAWRGLGDTCAKFLAKGKKVCVTGEPKPHAWIGRDGDARGEIEMNADEVEFLSPAGGREAPPAGTETGAEAGGTDPARTAPAQHQMGFTEVEPEELPF